MRQDNLCTFSLYPSSVPSVFAICLPCGFLCSASPGCCGRNHLSSPCFSGLNCWLSYSCLLLCLSLTVVLYRSGKLVPQSLCKLQSCLCRLPSCTAPTNNLKNQDCVIWRSQVVSGVSGAHWTQFHFYIRWVYGFHGKRPKTPGRMQPNLESAFKVFG